MMLRRDCHGFHSKVSQKYLGFQDHRMETKTYIVRSLALPGNCSCFAMLGYSLTCFVTRTPSIASILHTRSLVNTPSRSGVQSGTRETLEFAV
jgi:hypothetical protein